MSQHLSIQVFGLLRSLVEERAGLHYGPQDMAIFSDKVSARRAEAGFESTLDYYYYLRYDPGGAAELGQLVDALVVGETYLFREIDALSTAVNHGLLPAINERGRARLWSAGCSTGDEPFTVSMMLHGKGVRDKVDIVATDVSQRAIDKARAGTLQRRSLRGLVPGAVNPAPAWARPLVEKWLTPLPGDGAQVAQSLIDGITFLRDSIIQPDPSLIGFDVILCRNVLIYFDDAVAAKVVNGLAERLRPRGMLFVGASESLLRFGTRLRCEERSGAFFYTKEEA